jgi:hypothetical protein
MANYPFRINMKSKLGTKDLAWYTASLATDADTQISASVMVDRINNIPSASYEDGVAAPSGTSVHLFGGAKNLFMSCSHTDPNIGAIEFHDEENTVGGGLEYYTFWGAKVCSVLGLPEGIPIYTENFKLSDDSNDPDNYISGDIIAGGLSVKDSLKLSPQARVRSNLVWDEEFGEGLVQWVSGSTGKLLMGYDNVTDKYKISAAGASTFEISGVDNMTATEVDSNINTGTDGYVRGGTLNLLSNNRTSFDITDAEAQISMTSSNRSAMRGHLHLRHNDSSTWSNSLYTTDYTLALVNRHGDSTGDFAGIAFDVGSTDGANAGEDVIFSQAISAGIIVERDSSANSSTSNYDANMSFATNNAGVSGLTKRMTITHDGKVGIGEEDPDSTLEVNGTVQINGDAQIRATDKFYLDGGSNTYLTEDSGDSISVVVGGTTQAIIDSVQQRSVFRQNIYIQGATPTANSIDDDYLRFHNNGSNSYIDYGGGTLYIRDDGTTAITVDTSRNVTIANDLFVNDYARIDALRVGTTSTDPGDGNLHVEGTIQSEDGIRFGSDSAAANTLHDYEEGSWTPVLYNSGTVTTSTGNLYVKVGSLVTCWMKLVNIQESGTQTVDFAIGGLPFAVEFDCVGGTVMCNGFDFADDPDNVNNLTIWVRADETLRVYETKDGGSSWDPITWGDITDNDDMYGQFTYRTTA